MNRLLLVALVAVITMSLPGVGIAQTAEITAHAPTVKIGWMDADQAVLTSNEGVGALNELQKFVDEKNIELETMRRESDDLRARLEVQASRLTDEALMDLEERTIAHEIALQRFSEDTNREIERRRQRLYGTISAKMGPIIEKVALEKGLDAILIFEPQRDAWVNTALNVTEDIVAAYNQAYPAGAPIMPPAAKKP